MRTINEQGGSMSSKELTTQQSLSPEVFGNFINLKVSLGLGGTASFDLSELEKVLSGDPLNKGTELVVTARYFVKEIHMPVRRVEGWDSAARKKFNQYELGGAKVDLGLLDVEKIESSQGHVKRAIAAPCSCLVPIVEGEECPETYMEASYPLKGFWADVRCSQCRGKGYVRPKKNKAPLAEQEGHTNAPIVLVDVLPEPPDIPEGNCQECGCASGGSYWNHHHDCSERKRLDAEVAKARAERAELYAEDGEPTDDPDTDSE